MVKSHITSPTTRMTTFWRSGEELTPRGNGTHCAPNIPVAPGRMSLLQSGPANPDSAWRFDKILKNDGVRQWEGLIIPYNYEMENKIHV